MHSCWTVVGRGVWRASERVRQRTAHTKQQQGRNNKHRRTLRGVLEAAVLDGAQQLRLEQEVLEARRVDAHVALLGLVAALGGALLAGGDLLLLVVEELLLLVLRGHLGDAVWCVVWGGVCVVCWRWGERSCEVRGLKN